MTNDLTNTPVYQELQACIDARNVAKLQQLLIDYNLTISDGKIIPKNKEEYSDYVKFWNQRQQATKILLNSLYGALLNESMKFYDKRIGQSVTLTGRCITKHMTSQINQQITGEYDVYGESIVYNDTDSVSEDTTILINDQPVTISQAFDMCAIKWSVDDKEYACDDRLKTYTYNPETKQKLLSGFNYIYRHKTNKDKWEIEDSFGNKINVTNDHSCMVERNGSLLETKPEDILPSDKVISITT